MQGLKQVALILLLAVLSENLFFLPGAAGEESGEDYKYIESAEDDNSTAVGRQSGRSFDFSALASMSMSMSMSMSSSMSKSKKSHKGSKIKSKVKSSMKQSMSMALNFNLNAFDSCGCGDDKCEKFGKCQIKGFQPVCCNNKCMCAQTPKKFDSKAKTKLCKKCNDPKSTVCQAATASEFNCWSTYKDVDDDKVSDDDEKKAVVTQYCYF